MNETWVRLEAEILAKTIFKNSFKNFASLKDIRCAYKMVENAKSYTSRIFIVHIRMKCLFS